MSDLATTPTPTILPDAPPLPESIGEKPARPSAPQGASVARHYVRYLNAQLITSVAGSISLPVMSRVLSKAELGILTYFNLFPMLWVAFLKLGTQHSIQRFYPIYGLSEDPHKRREYYASFVAVPGLLSSGLFLLGMSGLLAWHHVSPVGDIKYLILVLILGQIGVLSSLTDNVLRAREQSKRSSFLAVVTTYTDLIFVLGAVFYFRTALGLYFGKIAAASLVCGYSLWWLIRNIELNVSAFNFSIFVESLKFGLPLVVSEISLIILAVGDRIMIRKYLPGTPEHVEAELGLYGLGYSLAMYIGMALRTTLASAYQPVANRLYQQHGAAAVRNFKHNLLKVLMYASIAATVGLLQGGRAAVHVILGIDKIDAAPVFIIVGINYVLVPIFTVAAYGLILIRKTRVIAWVVLVSAAINIALNFYLIPRLGIMGAVWATLIAYAFMGTYQVIKCPAELRTFPTARELALPVAAAAAWWGAVQGLDACGLLDALARGLSNIGHLIPIHRLQVAAHDASQSFAQIIIMGITFVLVFLLPTLGLDRNLRHELCKRIPALKRFA